jgi:methylmalonyl-CoA mutase
MASADSVHGVRLADGVHVTRAEWEKATAAVLRKLRKLGEDAPDSDVWTVLAHETLDGLTVTPLGTPEASQGLERPVLPAPHELDGWDVRGHFTDPDVEITAQHVVTDLENGVNSLWLVVGDDGVALDALERILEPVFLDLAPVVLQADDAAATGRELLRIATERGVSLHARTNLGLDESAVELAEEAKAAGVRAFVVDATEVHDRGASDVQELSYSLLKGVSLLRVLESQGIQAADAAPLIEFRYAATDEQFETIAKFRAARLLWARVLQMSGVAEAEPQAAHAVTSRPMFTKYDPYTNILRGTVAAFAAGVAGAESVTVLPFDEPLGLPEPFSRRIARNTSSLLIAESHVAKVADPAGGSHLVETLTDETAKAAWDLFSELEKGGADLDELIEATVSARALQIAKRKRPITGVSEFPNFGESLPERRPYAAPSDVHRYAGEFEEMRDEPAAQPVFLATLGTVAEHTARATFASNLLAAGGIASKAAGATANPEDVVLAYVEAGTPKVAMLAGPDAHYLDWGFDVIGALRTVGASRILIAGNPGDLDVDGSAAMGVDALAFLRSVREVLA